MNDLTYFTLIPQSPSCPKREPQAIQQGHKRHEGNSTDLNASNKNIIVLLNTKPADIIMRDAVFCDIEEVFGNNFE